MKRPRLRKRSGEEVEMNLAAMLDMAFQLLMFFILTFSPTPIEAQIATQLPATGPITQNMLPQASDAGPITVTILASDAGNIRDLAVNETIVSNPQAFKEQLQRSIAGRPPCGLVLQVDTKLNYQELVHVVDACLQVGGLADRSFDKLTFVELREKR